MPPWDGPREVLWCTRYPVYVRTVPSSIRIGTDTIRVRFGLRSTSSTLGSRFMILAAWSSWARAWSHTVPLTRDSFGPEGGSKRIPDASGVPRDRRPDRLPQEGAMV